MYGAIAIKTYLLFILNRLTASKLYSGGLLNLSALAPTSAQRLTAPDFCKFDLRDAETFFFQSGSSHISLNKVLFFGKAGVPTFYPFVPFVRSNCDQNKSSPHLNRLPASKLYSEKRMQ
ncbi:hypothetical protein FH583_15370 [Leptospira interrogans]|uniref:Uncharacterized protein n=1 Tax=Leptospira interrogans serovar Pyrogenes str. 200701872 TaxID=1193029 RepID=M6ZL78_LEPIR|nr:hypothetical protein [Leptospira interrogans]EMP04902.1 hypothetical protein LEP1GSC124_4835 [Leptospira interrogans serovar Pyrogenes str. 200701872]UML75335.1 hypothetical protein FH583_15370 [Leptospira interrogans]